MVAKTLLIQYTILTTHAKIGKNEWPDIFLGHPFRGHEGEGRAFSILFMTLLQKKLLNAHILTVKKIRTIKQGQGECKILNLLFSL